MTVAELIAELSKHDSNLEVLMVDTNSNDWKYISPTDVEIKKLYGEGKNTAVFVYGEG